MLAQLTATRIQGLFAPLVDLIEVGGGLIVLGVGTYELSQGRLSLGGLLAFMVYLSRIYSPVARADEPGELALLRRGRGRAGDRAARRAAGVTERPGALRRERLRGSLAVEDVWFSYPGRAWPGPARA